MDPNTRPPITLAISAILLIASTAADLWLVWSSPELTRRAIYLAHPWMFALTASMVVSVIAWGVSPGPRSP